MRSNLLKLLALLFAFTLIAAACGDDDETTTTGDDMTDEDMADDMSEDDDMADDDMADDMSDDMADDMSDDDNSVLVTGSERAENEAGAIQQVLGAWGEENGIEVTFLGSADWEAEINVQVEAGNPPDISIFPQPGKLADFAREGSLVPLSQSAADATATNWSEAWTVFGNVDGEQYGVPVKSDLKSLVWYQPARFEAAGYEVPETFGEFQDLVAQMAADGGPKPLCVGIESGQATGWTYTDWVEDMVLRQHGPDVYDDWVSHDIPFNDERIVESMDTVLQLWTSDNVFASQGSIAATAFQDNGGPLVDGDCYMHRQASFYAAFMPEGVAFADGSEDAVDVFYFPDINGDAPVLGAGTLAAAFNNHPSTMAVLEYMSSPEYAEARQRAQAELTEGALSGFLSAAIGQDPSVYAPLEQSFLNILATADIVRFDASDLMPADVGAGTFWTEGTSAVNGDLTAQEAADRIEASWPQ